MRSQKIYLKKAHGWIAATLLSIAATILYAEQLPFFSASGPDAEAYGAAEHFAVGSGPTAFEQKYMVGSFSHFETLFPTHTVLRAPHAWEFHIPAAAPQITYFHAGNRYLLGDYLAHMPVTGLLIAKDDQILFEGYQYGRSDRDRFTSESMAKTIVAMLVGVAISEHAVESTADVASKYVPELKDSAFGTATIRDLLHMSSGITCEAAESTLGTISVAALKQDCKQDAPAGTRFHYSAADSEVLGLILGRAVHVPLAAYLQEKIWQDIGTESKATWTIDSSNRELACCCFNATLRDYARFGRLLADDGVWNGKSIIPQSFLLEASTIKDSDSQLMPSKPAPFFGYGYQLWIFPGPRRMFGLLGAHGQRVFVDPQSKLILVQTAVMKKDVDPPSDAETIGLWLSLVHHYASS